ncbi:MAG: LysM peptidoglycan-binding domain-containing protein [Sphaerobacter sp.]|nr:LysM peptidoglycan-binding domain-containing protein [Sphaerobacter sp.]
MASEPRHEERDLVALYAERIRSRGDGLSGVGRPARPAPAVHQFGRPRRAPRGRSRLQRGGAASALVATALLVGAQSVAAATTHEVQPGDTLSELAERYHTTVPQLATINGIADPDVIMAGTTLTIEPDTTLPAGAAAEARRYEVKPGDTLAGIAAQFGVTIEAIVAANGIADPNLIAVGAVLVIPGGAPNATQPAAVPAEAGAPALHLVAEGETLAEIAATYGTTPEVLARANAIADPHHLLAGSLLQIPGITAVQDGKVMLQGMPTLRQSLPLSCESAAASIATAYWGNQISEWVFIENLPSHPNPHYGFRGSMTGAFGGTRDYGVYAEPLAEILQRYGFVGEVFYAQGNADLLKQQIDQGRPVVVWITNMASVQQRTYAWYDGERFALVPQEHAVVVYGYDAEQVYIVDPGDGAYRSLSWDDFLRSWGYFDGMSLAVYPA